MVTSRWWNFFNISSRAFLRRCWTVARQESRWWSWRRMSDVSFCNPSCCSALNFFYCFYIVCPRLWPSTPGLGGQKLYMLFLWFSCFRCLGFFWGSRMSCSLYCWWCLCGTPNSGCPVCLCQGILLCWRFAGCVRVGGMMVQFSFSFGWHSMCSISVDGSSWTTVFPMWWGNQDLFAAFSGPLCV